MTVDQIFNLLRNSDDIFVVEFERRTARPDGTAEAGAIRHMICRTQGVQQFKRGVIPDAVRDAQDWQHAILTVWSLDTFWGLQQRGMDDADAAFQAFRRIDLVTLKSLSLMPQAQLPPDIRQNFHRITNAYRLANMPRVPIP